MSNFIVSARKYRPDTFDTVVGQQSITQTLKNAIRTNQLAHAYLFSGPRGVGKTTSARIFAKTINCDHPNENLEPCNNCESCIAFNEGRSYNIRELDAASNNSVEDIRTLTDQVRIPPQIGQYSVYIIDEVHMLSQSAFNAFLKTLEEPPAHAIFILATTEKHKILPTILSRCQIFDFKRITVEEAAGHLASVAEKEGIQAEAEALNIIGQKADGAMRDALSMFDQIVSFSSGEVTYAKVLENLNVLDYDYYFRLTDAFLANDIPQALLIFNEILDKGFDGHHFVTGLSKHLRDLLICQDESTVELLEVGASIKERYLEQARKSPEDFLTKSLEISNQCDINYKGSTNQRLLVELALVQMAGITKKKTEHVATTKEEETNSQPAAETQAAEKPKETTSSPDEADEKKQTEPAANYGTPKPAQDRLKTRRQNGVSSTVSIKNALNNQQDETKQGVAEKPVQFSGEKRNSTFSAEDLTQAWLDYAEIIKNQSPHAANTLKNCKPQVKEDHKLVVTISNQVQNNRIKAIYSQLMGHLKNKLSNDYLELETHIANNAQKARPTTPQDKYRALLQKNPNLDKLRNNFDLDF